MRLVCRYVKEHIKDVCLYTGFIGIFAVIFYLYSIRTDAVLYAFLLSVIWLLLYAAVGFIRYVKKHRELQDQEGKITVKWEGFPCASGLLEEDYQRILKRLFECKLDIESESSIAKQEMQDYYSLWAHQIKTPIAAMHVLIQSRSGISSEADYQYLKELKLELFKIEQYVEMVLSYLRLGEMSSDLRLQWYSLDDIVRQAVRKYSQMFILQKIKLEFIPSEEMVLTDEKWLLLVVEQLLSNALKYTKSGSISIRFEKSGTGKELIIEDTGIGIWKEDLPRVFEKGFTGYNGRNDKKSTGIGLYLCKTVMDRLNHGIRIESEAGTGTKVRLMLERQEIMAE